MSCAEYPTADDAKTFKLDADTINQVVTSPLPLTTPASDGNEKRTLSGIVAEFDQTLIDLTEEYNQAIQAAGGVPLGDGVWGAGKVYTAYNQFLVYNGVPYKPLSTTTLPYTTQGADPTIAPDLSNVQPYSDVTQGYVAKVEKQATRLIIFPQSANLSATIGDTAPPNTTALRDAVNDNIYETSVAVSGEITAIDFSAGTATIGGVGVELVYFREIQYFNSTSTSALSKMLEDFSLSPLSEAIGARSSTGGTTWELEDSTGPITADNFRAFDVVNVLDTGAKADGVTSDVGAINEALATGRSIFLPDNGSYYIDGPLTPLLRYQEIHGSDLLAELLVDTSSSDFTAITISVDNMVKNLRIQATSPTNGTGIKISNGGLENNFSSTCTVKNVWARSFKNGIEFDNAFATKFYDCQFRQCQVGVRMTPTPTDNPSGGGYLANINFFACRWNGNTVNDILLSVPGPSRCRGVSLFGCDMDPVGVGATESINLTNAGLFKLVGCYLEATTSGGSGPKQLVASGSVFISFDTCLFSNTGGVSVTSSQVEFENCWSFSAVSSDNSDPIIADSASFVTVRNSTFRSNAHSFISTAARVSLIDATVRDESGAIQYYVSTHLSSGQRSQTNEYADGVFSPRYSPSSGSFGTVTYDPSNTRGTYTREGNLLHFSGAMRTTALSVGTANGSVSIDLNLPFISQITPQRAVVSLAEVGLFGAFSGDHPCSGSVIAGSHFVNLYYRSAINGPDLALDVTDLNAISGSANFLQFSGTMFIGD